ncbi:MAG TPA: prepilin-type N-terminal cleavage/methylation domain-containing protein [Armatimonadota bacterium]|jgi:prepilin-type N-terminal cleavage/methylation domain-containing protein
MTYLHAKHPLMMNGRRRGFTLVELLIAALIVSLGLIALSQLYIAALWTFQKARYTAVAVAYAQKEVETLQYYADTSYPALTTSTTTLSTLYLTPTYTVTGTSSVYTVRSSVDGLPSGLCTMTITPDPTLLGTTAGKNLAKVTIAVTWSASASSKRGQSPVNVITYVTKPAGGT